MSDQMTPTSLFGRIGNFFRRAIRDAELTQNQFPPLLGHGEEDAPPSLEALEEAEGSNDPNAPRTTFLRPWVKRDQAIDQLQNGVAALTDLMSTIRETMERGSERQDDFLNYLSKLPEAIESLPEANRLHGETLKAIQIGIEQQGTQQGKLSRVLERMGEGSIEHQRTLDAVRERVDMISMNEESLARSLNSVGLALQTVSDNSQASTIVLENLRENLSSRDSDLERVIRRQNTRFTTMLTVAIVMSMAALTAVVVFGYLGYETLSHMAR